MAETGKLVNYESEIRSLAAETMALQALFIGLTNALISNDSAMKATVTDAFDYAENIITVGAIKLGHSADPARQTIRAAEMLENVRSAVIANDGKPKQ